MPQPAYFAEMLSGSTFHQNPQEFAISSTPLGGNIIQKLKCGIFGGKKFNISTCGCLEVSHYNSNF